MFKNRSTRVWYAYHWLIPKLHYSYINCATWLGCIYEPHLCYSLTYWKPIIQCMQYVYVLVCVCVWFILIFARFSCILWHNCKESACQCRICKKHRFNFWWVRKILWSRKWQPTPVFLPGKFHGQGSLARSSTRGHKQSNMTEHTHRVLYF